VTTAADLTPEEVLAAAHPQLEVRSTQGRAVIAGFSLAHFSHHVTNSMLNPLLPLIRDTFALSYTQSGFAVSAYSLSLGLANAPMGVLADRFGPRRVLAGGLLLLGIASVALSLAGASWQLLLLLIGMGIVSGTYHAPAASLLSRTFPRRGRGAAMGFHITGGHFSFFAVPLVAGTLAAATGTWRTPYLWFAVAPIASGLLVWALAPKTHARPAARGRMEALRDLVAVARRVGPVVGISIAFQVGFAAFAAFLSVYMVDARGVGIVLASALFSVPNLGGLFGAPLGGWLSDRIGRRRVIALGLSVLGPLIWVFTVTPTELVILPLIVVGLVSSMRQTVTEVLVAESAPAERRATTLGAYYLLSAEVGGLAAPALGAIAGAAGIAAAFSYVGVLLTALSALAVVATVARKI
jgi:MFS family permease